jgi:hypothetical protein
MTVNFTHPHNSASFAADVDPACTGAAAVQGLIESKFLDEPGRGGYDLTHARTGAPIGPAVTLASCGVQENDSINVLRRGSGANRPA